MTEKLKSRDQVSINFCMLEKKYRFRLFFYYFLSSFFFLFYYFFISPQAIKLLDSAQCLGKVINILWKKSRRKNYLIEIAYQIIIFRNMQELFLCIKQFYSCIQEAGIF